MPNDSADENVIIKSLSSWPDQHQEVMEGVASAVKDNQVDAIFCVAGGWAGGNAASKSKCEYVRW